MVREERTDLDRGVRIDILIIDDHVSDSRFRAEPQGQSQVVTVVECIDNLAESSVAKVNTTCTRFGIACRFQVTDLERRGCANGF
jgi:predicted molibdopterin-dependent oxidoreductase YjgC